MQINTPQELKLKNFIDELFSKYDSDDSGCLDVAELSKAFNEVLAVMHIESQPLSQ